MSLLAPGALLFALLAAPILLLYMLKLRRREVDVSSTLLWQMLLHDRQANAPWQRLKRNLLLFLQLAILAALVLALARPARPVPSLASGFVVAVLDGSASMNARDGTGQNSASGEPGSSGVSRFDTARLLAQRLIEELPSNGSMTLILAGEQPQILASAESDKTDLRRKLDQAAPGQGPADWEAAFALAAGAASGAARSAGPENVALVILSDGGLPSAGLPPIAAQVRYVPIGHSGENLAISALALRPVRQKAELLASVTNYGASPHQAVLSFYSGDRLFTARQLDLAAGETANVVLDNLPGQAARYTARLSPAGGANAPLDAFPLDDTAYAIYKPPSGGRTLLVSQGNLFLEQLLARLPGVQPFRALPDEQGNLQIPAGDPFDLYVLDGDVPGLGPGELPPGNLLLVNPPSNDLFSVGGVFTDTAEAVVADSPLAEFVDWQNVHVRQAHQVTLPDWTQPLINTPSGPLVFAGETGGRRIAVLTFDLHESDLPLQVAFPVLFSNLVQYLIQSGPLPEQALENGLQPGEALAFSPALNAGQVRVTSPSGKVFTLQPDQNGVTFADTNQLGVYTVSYSAEPGRHDQFAVNLFSPLESDIRPAGSIQVGRSPVAATTPNATGLREYWPWLAALSLLFLLVEWWLYHRRQILPGDWLRRLRARLPGSLIRQRSQAGSPGDRP